MIDVLKKRLRAAMKERDFTQKSLALKSGLNETAVRDILQGRSKRPSYDTLKAIADTLLIRVDQLTSDDDPPAPWVASFDAPSPVNIGKDQYIPVPAYDIRAAAGAGSLNEDGEPVHHHFFRAQWLHRYTRGAIGALAVIVVAGDSMWETLHDGDHVLVDRSIRNPGRDGIYVIRLADELQVKRLSLHPQTKKLTVGSDNPRYPTYPDIDPEALDVIGRVVWIGRNMG